MCDHSSKTPCPVLLLGHRTGLQEAWAEGEGRVRRGQARKGQRLDSGVWAVGAP